MRVLFTITYYEPYVSGLTIAASRWAEGVEQAGHEVTVLCLFGAGKRVIRARSLFAISKGFFSIDWLLKSWQQVKHHDVIVVNLPQFEGVIPALFAKLMGKNVISIYHCQVVLPNKFIQTVLEISNRMTVFLSDTVVAYTKDYATSVNLPSRTKYIVPPIPKPVINRRLVQKFKKRIGKSEIVIGVAARLAAEKGIEYLLPVLSVLRATLVIAGSMEPVGEAAYKEKIMNLVSTYKKRVVFLGEISPNAMGSFYRCIDVLAVPSVNRTEAFGLVQVEAMLSGVPVVVSDLPGVRVPVQKTGMGIVVPPMDSSKLAQAIALIMKNKKKYLLSQTQVRKMFYSNPLL